MPDTAGPLIHSHAFNLAKQFSAQLIALTASRDDVGNRIDALTDALFRDALRERASDVHLEPRDGALRIRFRIDGELLTAAVVPIKHGSRLLNHLKAIGDLETSHLFRPQESRLDYELDEQPIDLRLAVMPCMKNELMVIRLLHPEMIQQEVGSLGLSDSDRSRITHWLNHTSGMLLVCGPTGSGKTTTVYALLHELGQRNRSIFTIEQPVEYHITGANQVQVDEDHELTFASGLRSILRMDPDYLMVGEIRDKPAAQAAMNAAIRGRVLLSTMHSRDPFGTVTAMRNWQIADNEIAVSLNMVIAQRLVRKLCPDCRYQAPPTNDQRRWLRAVDIDVPETIWHAGACENCRGLGYRGRTGVFEIWEVNEDDYQAILAGVDEHTLCKQVHRRGHRTMLDDAWAKAKQGVIALDEMRSVPDLLPRRGLRHLREALLFDGSESDQQDENASATSNAKAGRQRPSTVVE